jgi:hypothetical protein
VVECGCQNGHHKNSCLPKIGLQTPNLLTILGSIINIVGDLPFDELEKAHTLLINEVFK